jgi:hypothetical protein
MRSVGTVVGIFHLSFKFEKSNNSSLPDKYSLHLYSSFVTGLEVERGHSLSYLVCFRLVVGLLLNIHLFWGLNADIHCLSSMLPTGCWFIIEHSFVLEVERGHSLSYLVCFRLVVGLLLNIHLFSGVESRQFIVCLVCSLFSVWLAFFQDRVIDVSVYRSVLAWGK